MAKRKSTQPRTEEQTDGYGDWDAEVAAWMVARSRCERCGDELARDPAVLGNWLSATEQHQPGVCRPVPPGECTSPHEPGPVTEENDGG